MANNEGLQVVVFRAGESEYCADIRDVREIIRLDSITNLPGSGGLVEGIINVRGEIIPLIALRSLTDIPRRETDNETRVLIVDHKPAFGLIVDMVGEVKNVPRDAVVPLPAIIKDRINSDLFTGVGKLPDRILIIVDLKKVIVKDNGQTDRSKIDTASAPEEENREMTDESNAIAVSPRIDTTISPQTTEASPVPIASESSQPEVCTGSVIPAKPAEPTIEVLVKDQRLTDIHLDALREVGNIGTSHAATSLSTLVGSPINITVPSIKLVPINNVAGILNEAKVVGLLLEIKNDEYAAGFLYNLFPESSALRIVDRLMGLDSGTTRELDEMGQSAIMEVGNIISSSFCDAVADLLGVPLLPTPPNYVCDMADSILQSTLIEISMMTDDAIIFRTDLADDDHIFEGYVLYFPNPDTLDKILHIIDTKLSG